MVSAGRIQAKRLAGSSAYDVLVSHNEPRALLEYDQALDLILERLDALKSEPVASKDAFGRTLRQDLQTDSDLPPFHRSTMDGFAICAETFRPETLYTVVGSIAAGGIWKSDKESVDQEIAALGIATGAMVPPPFNAVIPREQAEVHHTRQVEQVRFTTESIEPWTNVHCQGSDAKYGEKVLLAGTHLAATHVGIATTVGASTIRVSRRPRVSLLTTGDEVRELDCRTLTRGQIRNSNGPMLECLINFWGGAVQRHRHVTDDPIPTLDAASKVLYESDLVVTTGGVSAGKRDLLPRMWGELGLETILHGVRIQPGKPLFVASGPKNGSSKQASGSRARIILGLPGNPVSALVTAHLFLWPVLRSLLGMNPQELPWRSVRTTGEVKPGAHRQLFRAARFVGEGRDMVELIPWHGSGDLVHTVSADGLVKLPLQEQIVPAGTIVPILEHL